jgi:RNA polymerase sigma factor (sigma-70 family)
MQPVAFNSALPMNERTEAERHLLEEIRRGSGDAWSQLVERYQGRLTAFARHRVPKGTEAEDLVQDTFLHFLRGLAGYREEASVETYLFLILRRRLAELHRGRLVRVCSLPTNDDASDAADNAPAPDPTASWYIRRDEQHDMARTALTTALRSLLHGMRENLELHDMQIVELVFYAQWPNQQIATELGEDAGRIAVLKHRWLKQLRDRVLQLLAQDEPAIPWDAPQTLDSLLTEIWEDERPSCPKRSTVGSYFLNTLDHPWQGYVDFHINRVGCSFCRANLEDFQKQNHQDPVPLRNRILQSTVGFFSHSART